MPIWKDLVRWENIGDVAAQGHGRIQFVTNVSCPHGRHGYCRAVVRNNRCMWPVRIGSTSKFCPPPPETVKGDTHELFLVNDYIGTLEYHVLTKRLRMCRRRPSISPSSLLNAVVLEYSCFRMIAYLASRSVGCVDLLLTKLIALNNDCSASLTDITLRSLLLMIRRAQKAASNIILMW